MKMRRGTGQGAYSGVIIVPFLILFFTILIMAILTALLVSHTQRRNDFVRSSWYLDQGLELGEEYVAEQVTSFLERPEVGGVNFICWNYFSERSPSMTCLALTAGRPRDSQEGYLNQSNTVWLGTMRQDPDALWNEVSMDGEVVAINRKGVFSPPSQMVADIGELQVDGYQLRFAAWVEAENSRLDLNAVSQQVREKGANVNELSWVKGLEKSEVVNPGGLEWNSVGGWQKGKRVKAHFPDGLKSLVTAYSSTVNRMRHAPAYDHTQKEGLPAYRGLPKMNWNRSSLRASSSLRNDEGRVAELRNWIDRAAPSLREKGAPGMFRLGASVMPPAWEQPLSGDQRADQWDSLLAGMIDYLDEDDLPCQPVLLQNLKLLEVDQETPRSLLLHDTERPLFFGSERVPYLNAVEMIWNCRGKKDRYRAGSVINRTKTKKGYRYRIPVTWRFELWNMDAHPIEARSYSIRVLGSQQILGESLGVRTRPIPAHSEYVLEVNGGAPVHFAPGEVKVVEMTQVFEREGEHDRGNRWSDFREDSKALRKGWRHAPKNTQQMSCVLVDPMTQKWLHATTYREMNNTVSGRAYSQLGSQGSFYGSVINDPRGETMRRYFPNPLSLAALTGLKINQRKDRDGYSNVRGQMGSLNRRPHLYQNFDYWADASSTESGSSIVTRIKPEGEPLQSIGELALVYSPSHVHEAGRGVKGSKVAYYQGVYSPFHGGGCLLDQNYPADFPRSQKEEELFECLGVTSSDQLFCPPSRRGVMNVNCPKILPLSATKEGLKIVSNLDPVFDLPLLQWQSTNRALVPSMISQAIKDRLTSSKEKQTWKEARPYFGIGEFGRDSFWEDPELYKPTVKVAASGKLELSGPEKREVFVKTAQALTTQTSHFRVYLWAELRKGGEILGERRAVRSLEFLGRWNEKTGELEGMDCLSREIPD